VNCGEINRKEHYDLHKVRKVFVLLEEGKLRKALDVIVLMNC